MENQSKLKDANIILIQGNKEYGDVVAVAKKLKLSRQYVSQACSIHSDVYDENVMLEMLTLIEKRKAKQKTITDKIAKKVKALKAA